MPSGSGISGGGSSGSSHSGGGFSGSSHSRGGSYGGGGSFGSGGMFYRGTRGGRPVFIFGFGGGRYYTSSKIGYAISTLLVFIFISIFACIISGAIWGQYNSDNDIIKSDYQRYSAMSSYAISHPEYQIEGEFQYYRQYELTGKYRVFYTFKDKHGITYGLNGTAYTFYTFTYDQIKDFHRGDVFMLASDSTLEQIDSETDTVDLYFANTVLEDDIEYVKNLQGANTAKTFLIISVCIAGVLIIGTIALFFKGIKKDGQALEKLAKETTTTTNTTNKVNKCKYCGATLKEGQTHCDRCGGSA